MENIIPFVTAHWPLFAAFALILVLLIANETKRKFLGYKDVKPNEAVQLINHDDAIVIDVRDDSDYAKGHILNAIHAPYALLDGRMKELEQYRDRVVIAYCRTGQQSARAAMMFCRHGFNKVYKIKGGLLAWESANVPTSVD